MSLVKSRGLAHLAALGLVPMMLCDVTVKLVVSIEPTGLLRTNCSGETRLALHIYIPPHEPESAILIIIIKSTTPSMTLCYTVPTQCYTVSKV